MELTKKPKLLDKPHSALHFRTEHLSETDPRHLLQLSFSNLPAQLTLQSQTQLLEFKIYEQLSLTQPWKPKPPPHPISSGPAVNKTSLKILSEKEKKGQHYIPIHLRTQNDLRKKNEHLNRIKDEMVMRQERELRECTFRPHINNKPIRRREGDVERRDVVQRLLGPRERTKKREKKEEDCITKTKHNRSVSNKENIIERMSFTTTGKEDSRTIGTIANQDSQSQIFVNSQTTKSKSQYKNKSFNILLDMIH